MMAADKSGENVGFIVVQNGIIVDDFEAEIGGFPSRLGQPAPPLAKNDCEPLPEGDAAIDEDEAEEAATTDAAPTARAIVAGIAGRRKKRADHV